MAQVIWFFDQPTILACGYCDRIASYHTETICHICGRSMIEFKADTYEYHESVDNLDIYPPQRKNRR